MMMKRFLAPMALLSLPLLTMGQDLPAPSPAATVQQRIGLADISVTYSRPSIKGRQIFGGLVPYGELWRTGANKSTLFITTELLMVGGQKLAPGKYSMFTIPNEGAWMIVFNSNAELWGTEGYKMEEDVIRVKAEASDAPLTETFTIGFENLGMDVGDLVFRWEKKRVVVPIVANATEKGIANIQAELAKPDADFRAYARSAAFYLERELEPKVAFEYANKSVSMEKKHWNTFYLAKAQAAMGMLPEAIASGNEAISMAVAEKDASAQKTYQEKVNEWTTKATGK
jgi:hypothetical protein